LLGPLRLGLGVGDQLLTITGQAIALTLGESLHDLKEDQRQPIDIYPIGSRAGGKSDDLV